MLNLKRTAQGDDVVVMVVEQGEYPMPDDPSRKTTAPYRGLNRVSAIRKKTEETLNNVFYIGSSRDL